MTVSLTLRTIPGSFLPAANKAGKVTATAEKVADTLNSMSHAAIVGAALTSHGAIGKLARESVQGGAVTLASLLACEALDGSQWGDLFALLRGAYGVADFNRATMRGRNGVATYMSAVRTSLVQRFDRAETAKAQAGAYKSLQVFDVVAAAVTRLQVVADAAAQAAREAETLALQAEGEAAEGEAAEGEAAEGEAAEGEAPQTE